MIDNTVMEDDDLYRIATEELNNGKRRMDLWQRACALASDDHDEARFLYTNLRVEQLTKAPHAEDFADEPAEFATEADIAPVEARIANTDAQAIAIPADDGADAAVGEQSSLVVEFDDTLPDEPPMTERLDDPDFDDSMEVPVQSAGVDDVPADAADRHAAKASSRLEQHGDTGSGLGHKPFFVYRDERGEFRAVRQGGSLPALLLTFPWLIARGLLGTALIYALLWLVLIGGLLVLALVWSDAGGTPSIAVQLLTGAFVILAIAGLLYVPFRYANRWYRERLERRGYQFQRQIEARDPRQAIDRVRPYAR